MTPTPLQIERRAAAERPLEPVIGNQRWQSMLFLHWPLQPSALDGHIPRRLTLDTYDDHAWVSAALYTVTGARLRQLPAVPGLSSFHEVDLRTYVHFDGKDPGVWFFNRDATNFITCALGRFSLRMPYFLSRTRRSQNGEEYRFESKRLASKAPQAQLYAKWRAHGPALETPSSSLAHFLFQRFFVYSPSAVTRLWREQLHHPPWPLFPAEVLELDQDLDEAHELPLLSKRPLAHYSPGVDVEFFPPHLV